MTPMVIIQSPDTGRTYPHYAGKVSIILGSFQITIGILCILLNICLVIPGLRTEFAFGYVGMGFWCGIMVHMV